MPLQHLSYLPNGRPADPVLVCVKTKRTGAREERLLLPKGRKLPLTYSAAARLYLTKLKEISGKDYTSNE